MTHLERLAVTTMLLSLASAPALAQSGTKWVGGETGMAVYNTPSTADRAQVKADLTQARKTNGWDQRLDGDNYPADPAAAQQPRSRDVVKQELATAVEHGVNLNPRPQ